MPAVALCAPAAAAAVGDEEQEGELDEGLEGEEGEQLLLGAGEEGEEGEAAEGEEEAEEGEDEDEEVFGEYEDDPGQEEIQRVSGGRGWGVGAGGMLLWEHACLGARGFVRHGQGVLPRFTEGILVPGRIKTSLPCSMPVIYTMCRGTAPLRGSMVFRWHTCVLLELPCPAPSMCSHTPGPPRTVFLLLQSLLPSHSPQHTVCLLLLLLLSLPPQLESLFTPDPAQQDDAWMDEMDELDGAAGGYGNRCVTITQRRTAPPHAMFTLQA